MQSPYDLISILPLLTLKRKLTKTKRKKLLSRGYKSDMFSPQTSDKRI